MGEQGQNLIHCPADGLDATTAPRPDRRADEMDGADPAALQTRFEIQVEVRRVDPDEQVRRIGKETLLEGPPDTGDLPVMFEHFEIAPHGELLRRPPGLEALPLHARPPDAEELRRRQPLPQGGQQMAGEQIAGGLARHQGV